jgi:predicted Zn-ribbon and HTH transcriptional regulator
MIESQYEEETIVMPDECPKCHSKNVHCSDWKDAYIVHLHIQCRECGFRWHEKVDLTL